MLQPSANLKLARGYLKARTTAAGSYLKVTYELQKCERRRGQVPGPAAELSERERGDFPNLALGRT